MCGFVSSVGLIDQARLVRGTRALAHRGPDEEAFFQSPEFSAGFRRLKIIDLSHDARQPMSDASGRFWIVFNGEIYNYRELRSELLRAGWSFRTQSDTEVLLTTYLAWGEDCVSRLNGMFAFLIWDSRELQLFGARDRFGEKPLYYAEDAGRLLFASEIKGLFPLLGRIPEPNSGVMRRYIEDRWTDFSEHTFFRGVRSVEPAHVLKVRDGRLETHAYWRLEESNVRIEKDVVSQFRETFMDSLRLRVRADVPVGSCLSGGLDSGSIVCGIPHVLGAANQTYSRKTFTAAYPEFNESREVADVNRLSGANGHVCIPTPRRLEDLSEMLWFHDEPFHSFAAYASYELIRLARANGVTVLLNGQGADETLAGYQKYFTTYLASLLRSGRIAAAMSAARSAQALTNRLAWPLLREAANSGLRAEARRWLPPFCRAGRRGSAPSMFSPEFETLTREAIAPRWEETSRCDVLHAALKHSIRVCNLPLYLRVEDRNSMAHSSEIRLPFLDHRLAELAFSLPAHWLMKEGRNKYLLREAMHGVLPESVRSRRDKLGFPIPEVQWLYGDFREGVEELLSSASFAGRGIFDSQQLLIDYQQEADLWQRTRCNMWSQRSKWFRVVLLELWQRNLAAYSRLLDSQPACVPPARRVNDDSIVACER